MELQHLITNDMKKTLLPFSTIPQLAKTDKAYATKDEKLRLFFEHPVSLSQFERVMQEKEKQNIDRQLLQSVILEQYQKLDTSVKTAENIKILTDQNTFTVTTAHQPMLLLGPLYFIYKIISTINLSESLKERYPDRNFVPVFVIGGEDHDFGEVNHIHLFNKTLRWESDERGSVGSMKTDSLLPVLEQLREVLGDSENAKEIFQFIWEAYTAHTTYAEATLDLINRLFGVYGLVVINMNHAKLKRAFLPVLSKELFEQPSKKLVEETQGKLTALGFKSQAFPREINLFYLQEQLRERIVFDEGVFKVLNTDLVFSTAEMEKELQAHPERFSPNVILRPLYQEFILPNLAYIGGGGEIAYWLERKSQFAHFGIPFPMLIRRNSVLWLDKASLDRMKKLNLEVGDLFEDVERLVRKYVETHAEGELSLEDQKKMLGVLFEEVVRKASVVDPTLEKAVLAEGAKQLKSLEGIEERLLKAEKQKRDTAINQLRGLINRLFPESGLQERYDNFIPYYIKYGKNYLDALKKSLHPLEEGYVVLAEDQDLQG